MTERPNGASEAETVGRVSTGGLATTDDFDDLATSQAKVFGHRIAVLNPWELPLLDAVLLEQRLLLDAAQQDVLRHQLVMRNIHRQVLLLESFDADRQHGGYDLERGRRHAVRINHQSGRKVVLLDVLREVAHLLDADLRMSDEIHPYRSQFGLSRAERLVDAIVRVHLVLLDHGGRRVGLEIHALSAMERLLDFQPWSVVVFAHSARP